MRIVLAAVLLFGASAMARAEVLLFKDGSEIEVDRYEVHDDVVVLVTEEGRLRSVPRRYVDLDATRKRRHLGLAPNARVTDAMVAEAVELVGLRSLTEEVSVSAQRAAKGVRHASLPPDLVVESTAQGFARDYLFDVAERAFRKKASSPRLHTALQWLRSPLARGIQRAVSSSPDVSFDSFVATLTASPPPKRRVELLQRLDTASGTSEWAVEIQLAMMKALLEGLGAHPEDTDAAVHRARSELARKVRGRVRLSLLYVYRNVSDEEISRYLAYLESEDGSWLSDLILESLYVAMERGARLSGEIIHERMKGRGKVRI